MTLDQSPAFVHVGVGRASVFIWSTNEVFDVFQPLAAEREFEDATDKYIPAIIFLVTAPYNRSRFIRFHSFQSIFFCVAMIAIGIALSILSVIPFLVLITLPLHLVVWVGGFILWIILLLKANQGQMFKLPVIGDMAEKQADAA